MNELLVHPAFQGGVAPFGAAVVMALLLRNRLPGIAIAVAFATGVALLIGWDIEPMNASRKLAFVGVAAGIATLAIEWARVADRWVPRLAASLAFGCATLWVIAGMLRQMEGAAAVIAGSTSVLFVALLAYGPVPLRAPAAPDGLRASVSAMVLAFTAGLLALLGGSLVLALMAIAAAAGAAGLLLLQVLRLRTYTVDWSLAMPAGVVGALVAVMGCLSAGLPWYAPVPLIAVPWAARAVRVPGRGLWAQAAAALVGTLVPAAAAIALSFVHP